MQIHYPKIFLLTLFFTTGITLFSCTNKEANKKQNDKIVVVDSENNQNNKPKQISQSSPSMKENQLEHSEKTIETNTEEVVTKKTASDKNNSAYSVSTSAKTDMVKSIRSEENVSNTEKDKKNSTTKKGVVSKGEAPLNKNAELPGGIDQFYTFFEKEYKRPENTTKLKITISFAVEKNGSVSYLASEPAVDKIVETEIIRVLNLSPKWQPGEANGKKIKMQYSLPILLK